MSEPRAESGPPAEPEDAVEPAADPAATDHDPTGLGLARAIAASVAGRRPNRRRTPRTRSTDRLSDHPGPQVSGAHPDDRDPATLDAAVNHLVEAKGWSKNVGVHTLLGRWPRLVGDVNAAHSHPESYADGVITVRAESTVWATSLRTIAPQLVAELNRQLGDGTVTRVQVLGPQGPSWKRGPRSVSDGRGPRDTYG